MVRLKCFFCKVFFFANTACAERSASSPTIVSQTNPLLSPHSQVPGEQGELLWKTDSLGVGTTTSGTPVFPMAMHADTSQVVLTLRLPETASKVTVERCMLTNVLDPAIAPRVGPTTNLASRKASCPAVSVAEVAHREFALTEVDPLVHTI